MKYKCLTFEKRRIIADMYAKGATPREMAKCIGVHVSTIYNELERGKTGNMICISRPEYNPNVSEERAQAARHRRGRPKKQI